MYRDTFKRLMDIVLSGSALVVLSPFMLATAVAIRREDGGPALFHQERVGKDGKPFRVSKFRSMPVNTANVPSADAEHLTITKVGQFIRRTSIDELPQLFSILRGDMSIVGPRPSLASQAALNELRQANGALSCKPGLTGLAQIHGYDGMPDTEKANWDGQYAQNVTFLQDVTIILKTFGYLFRRPPVY